MQLLDKLFYSEDSSPWALRNKGTPEVGYSVQIESKIEKIWNDALWWMMLPFSILQDLASLVVVPSSTFVETDAFGRAATRYFGLEEDYGEDWNEIPGEFQGRRFGVEVDGTVIDCILMGKPENLRNGRWVLNACGNGQFYEDRMRSFDFKHILKQTGSNGLLFNYPGVGDSEGVPNPREIRKAYRAMRRVLEDGIGAKEIIEYGHSLGGGIQGACHALDEPKEGVTYVSVKRQTFSTLATAASEMVLKVAGFALWLFGLNIDTMGGSRGLKHHEIILAKTKSHIGAGLTDPEEVVGDGVIPKRASLAYQALKDPSFPKENKTFIGVRTDHNYSLEMWEIREVAQAIRDALPR